VAYASGELKHGTISLIEKDSVVVALMGNSEVAGKTFSNIREIKSRGGRVIGLISDGILGKQEKEELDRVIELPLCQGIFSSLYEGVVLQLFSYYVAKKRGCDIDKPRNLAKSVTVE
jgi:glucosamine--fructose-6-phosphate aminotransferase (isomerizing)